MPNLSGTSRIANDGHFINCPVAHETSPIGPAAKVTANISN